MGCLDFVLEALGSHRKFLSIVVEVEIIHRAREAVFLVVT